HNAASRHQNRETPMVPLLVSNLSSSVLNRGQYLAAGFVAQGVGHYDGDRIVPGRDEHAVVGPSIPGHRDMPWGLLRYRDGAEGRERRLIEERNCHLDGLIEVGRQVELDLLRTDRRPEHRRCHADVGDSWLAPVR